MKEKGKKEVKKGKEITQKSEAKKKKKRRGKGV